MHVTFEHQVADPMSESGPWPPTMRNRTAILRAYSEVLGWPLVVACRTVSPEQAEDVLLTGELSLRTVCAGFDAVVVPREAGLAALVRVEHALGPVVSLTDSRTVTFLVRGGTAKKLEALDAVQVKSGTDASIALPPSLGVNWDTPPWSWASRVPRQFYDAELLRFSLSESVRLVSAKPSA